MAARAFASSDPVDFDALACFRESARALLSAGHDSRAVLISRVEACASRLPLHAVLDEVGMIKQTIHRIILLRHLPSSSYRSRLLSRPDFVCKLLVPRDDDDDADAQVPVALLVAQVVAFTTQCAAQMPSIVLETSSWSRFLTRAPRAASFTSRFCKLVYKLRDTLSECRDIVSVVPAHLPLTPVDDALHETWAVMRRTSQTLTQLLATARRLRLFLDVHQMHQYVIAANRFHLLVVARSVPLPGLEVTLGAALYTRQPVCDALDDDEDDDDEDDIEWEEQVTLTTMPITQPQLPSQQLPQSAPQSQPEPSSHPPTPSPSPRPTTSATPAHNAAILQALDAATRIHPPPPSRGSKAYRKPATTARDRIRTKLGIKKPKRSHPSFR